MSLSDSKSSCYWAAVGHHLSYQPCSKTCPWFDLNDQNNRSFLWFDSDVHLWFILWSLQEPTKSAKSSTKNSNAGGGKDAGTENSEEVKMTVLKTYLILCLTVGLPSGLGTNTCLLSVVAGLFHSSGHKKAILNPFCEAAFIMHSNPCTSCWFCLCFCYSMLHTVASLACQTHKSEVYHAEDR